MMLSGSATTLWAMSMPPRPTVATHVQHIFAKLDLPSEASDDHRVHAVLVYLTAQPGRR